MQTPTLIRAKKYRVEGRSESPINAHFGSSATLLWQATRAVQVRTHLSRSAHERQTSSRKPTTHGHGSARAVTRRPGFSTQGVLSGVGGPAQRPITVADRAEQPPGTRV